MNQPPKEQKSQLIRIDRGISQFNHDYYAALGLPIITSPIYIRHVYVSIARILHPDVYGFSAEQKEVATQYLAKLVNPAYNVLMKEQERQAYQAIFKLLAKRLMQKSRNIPIYSTAACELMSAPSDGFYERKVASIAKLQYQSLQNILEYTAQVSELNLVYILYKEGYQYGAPNLPPVLMPMANKNYQLASDRQIDRQVNKQINQQADATVIQTITQTRIQTSIESSIQINDVSAIGDRLKICEIYISQNDWKKALRELRDILMLDKNNSKCLAMLGVVYKNINQPQMAKISLQRSLQLNPQEPLALKHIKDLSNSNSINPKTNPKQNPATNIKKKPLPPPQKRGWLANLLGWITPDDSK